MLLLTWCTAERVQRPAHPTRPHAQLGSAHVCREVVERRTYTVTGQKASPEEIDRLIETGESEQIFQKAILEQGRGHVRLPSPFPEWAAA